MSINLFPSSRPIIKHANSVTAVLINPLRDDNTSIFHHAIDE